MFDGRWRTGVERGINPVGSALRRTGLRADQLTATGLILAAAAAVAIGSGRLGLGLTLVIASALPDLLDGAVAKAAGTASMRGAFFDSVSDRVSDALILGGFAWYLERRGPHWMILPFALLGVSALVSYERAKAESLGLHAKGGIMERAERVIALCIALAFSVIMVPVLIAMLALTSLTAVQRFIKVWREADAPPKRRRESVRLRGESGSRSGLGRWEAWEARREARRTARGADGRRSWRDHTRTRP